MDKDQVAAKSEGGVRKGHTLLGHSMPPSLGGIGI